MRAMILAAGLGTRLRPLTNTIPKPLLPVGGTPLIVWNLLLLKRHGFRQVVINLHHLGPMIEQTLGTGSKFGIRIIYSHEPVILGTGGGIKQAEPHFSGEPVLILNGDTLVELDLEALCDFHRLRNAAATLVLREDPDAARWGLVSSRSLEVLGRSQRSADACVEPRRSVGARETRRRSVPLRRSMPNPSQRNPLPASVLACRWLNWKRSSAVRNVRTWRSEPGPQMASCSRPTSYTNTDSSPRM